MVATGVPDATADHPRVSGEHAWGSGGTRRLPGSSPRERGALVVDEPGYKVRGIIPA